MSQIETLTLILDIGKSHAKLLMVDGAGTVVERHGRDNASVMSALGYPALDLGGLGNWITASLRSSPNTARCSRVIACTHGAAVVALAGNAPGALSGVAWDPLDYEFNGYEPVAQAFLLAREEAHDVFDHTLSPDLPAGLNIARQLYWLQHSHPQAWSRTCCLVPYAQYWAWWLSGVAASERSSLGCHTQLWQPQANDFSDLAKSQGWAALFAPMRSAWEVLGPVRSALAQDLGLPATCEVHVGVHDSNACLARYLVGQKVAKGVDGTDIAGDTTVAKALTVVSSGTWTVLMAPGAPVANLQAAQDMLGNVDVLGRATPTARFMGGREFAALLDGALPDAGTLADVQTLIASRTFAMPSFARQGGPFMDREGWVEQDGERLAWPLANSLPPGQRAALAALYCAQLTAWLVQRLWRRTGQGGEQGDKGTELHLGVHRVVVEGPLAHNAIYLSVLQALLPGHQCQFSTDDMEGTARGAWTLSQWGKPESGQAGQPFLGAVEVGELHGLADYQAQWLAPLAEQVTTK